ncbi:winged helix-turn-helix transcriptional regulator [Paenibacillus sp. LMG 31456]|uniref:Winged helix-turn-helix transcriptional regulator n=1 Tax=Paenibacillus foliorum TaxID=2654974 RepID=A0A972K4R0_9BACL|nr:winged helix-turn-helix transcriptional regulator [Paenibacillus foliorum]NOU97208.1 winged helix-turn-helix transcriptional regulator [Paenibacillus foliorum]
MIYIKELKSGLPIFKALSSDIRIQIIELLATHDSLNLNDIAGKLSLTNGAVTMHIKKLEESGLIKINTAVGKHGIQKICYLNEDKLMVDLRNKENKNLYEVEIKLGHYSAYEAHPTCGLATKDRIIGEFDDPRYFADPEHINAEIIWLTEGYFEYRIPNYLKPNQQFEELQFIMELGSEAPGYCNNWPSDIYFHLNDIELGFWTSPGDFGGEKGTFNPDWWLPNLNQYGVLKMIRINKDGSFIDGQKISETTLASIGLDYKSDIKLRFSVPSKAKNLHGLTIYGSKFGNYNQDILARVLYK